MAVRIENRAQLVYLLTEAAELEHGILCCYLFASMSMKESTKEGVTAHQLAGMDRWRRLGFGPIFQNPKSNPRPQSLTPTSSRCRSKSAGSS